MRVILRGRRNIWRRWRVSTAAPRIVNDISYVTRINDASHFSWHAQAAFDDLGVSLFVAGAVFGDLGVSFFVAGAAFGDLGVSLFVAGAVFGEIWVDSGSAKCCHFR